MTKNEKKEEEKNAQHEFGFLSAMFDSHDQIKKFAETFKDTARDGILVNQLRCYTRF